jgi:hypothetical protein
VIKGDLMAALQAVWGKNFRNVWMLNSAYITLIPKKTEADQVKDFRPISLVHSFAKLVTKMLANRLASHLDQMVSPNQSAFIKKRFIQDNFMLVQQTARFLHSQKQPRILLKLDITKAFESVSWSFLLDGVIFCVVYWDLLPLRYSLMVSLVIPSNIEEDFVKGISSL